MGVKLSAQHLCSLVHAVLHVARVISQHTLLDDAESPGHFLHFLTLLPHELKDVLPSLSSWRNTQVHFPHSCELCIHRSFYQRIVRRGVVRNTWEQVFWSRMAHHLGRARLTSASPPCGPGKTLLGDKALPVGCHTETIVWTVLGHKLRRFCSAPQEIPYARLSCASFKREPVYKFSSNFQRTHITVMRRWHSFSSLLPLRHSEIYTQRRRLGHTSFSMHGYGRNYSVPRFQPGIDPFI